MTILSTDENPNNATTENDLTDDYRVVATENTILAVPIITGSPSNSSASLGALLDALGLPRGPGGNGSGMTIRCLWHDDTNPSCSVRVIEGGAVVYKCFACDAKGGVRDLISKVQQLDPTRDLARAREIAKDLRCSDVKTTAPPPASPARPSIDLAARVLLDMLPLAKNPTAVEYLERRGLLQQAQDDGWGALPPDAADWTPLLTELGPNAVLLGIATAAGKPRSAIHQLVIPWRSPSGEIVSIQRRVLVGAPDNKYIFPKGYGPLWPYGSERITAHEAPIAIVEGAMDTLAMRALCAREGIERDVIGLPGLQTWRAEWASLVSARVVLIAVDDDDAGARAAPKVARHVATAGANEARRRKPIGAKDWASLTEVR